MPKDTSGPEEKPAAVPVTVDTIRSECLDAQGYVVFAGIISNDRDAQGNNLINFRYIREKVSYEDTKRAIAEFEGAFFRDVTSL